MAELNNKALAIRPKDGCEWDLVSLGEVMLRLDPGDSRVATTRQFRAWEGGGEYNVARGLRRCFRMSTAIVTALADNAIGRLLEDLMLQGGVNLRHLRDGRRTVVSHGRHLLCPLGDCSPGRNGGHVRR